MERSIGFLGRVSGHTYDTIYDLLFTTERVIVIIVHHPTDVQFKFGVTELFLGGQLARKRERFDRKKFAEERLCTYKEKTFDELLTSHRFNFEIPYNKVTSFEVTRGLFQARLKIHISGPSFKERTIQFTLAKNQISDARNLLDLVLPLKIKNKDKVSSKY
jgi:hypothetical protein